MIVVLTSRSVFILQQQPSSSEIRRSTRPSTYQPKLSFVTLPDRNLPPARVNIISTDIRPIIHVHHVRVIAQHWLTYIHSEIMPIISSIDNPIGSNTQQCRRIERGRLVGRSTDQWSKVVEFACRGICHCTFWIGILFRGVCSWEKVCGRY